MKKTFSRIIFLLITSLSFDTLAQNILPPAGKTLLVIGQDLKSVADYKSADLPEPGGVTSYVNLYDIANAGAYFPYGGLGEKVDGSAATDVDWGAGPLNTRNASLGYSNSTLALGIYMTEDYYPGGLAKIANGTYDTEITRLGNFLKKIDKPFFLRIGYEFDGKWNTGYENKTNYKNAYKHIVDIIRPLAPKTMMVLQASTSPVDDILEGYHENIEDWYPGNDYVDYLGYSWFLNTPQQVQLTDELLALARKYNKPVMVCEAAPQGYDLKNLTYRYINTMLGGNPGTNPVTKTADQIWAEWFTPFFNYIHNNSDVIRVVSYINCNWDSQSKWGPPYNEGYWGDSRVEANAAIKAKWQAEIFKSSWLHGSNGLFASLSGGSGSTTDPTPDPETDPGTGSSSSFAPEAGKTLVLIGQTYTQEYKDYVNATMKAPAGSSHYGELYSGTINQGDDASNESFLSYIETNYPNAYCELAISIKDNPASGGYTGENAVWKACKDIVTGKWDAKIDQLALRIKGRPSLRFMVRICYEVSLNMFANKTTTPFVDILNKYNNLGINPLEKADQVTEFDLNAYKDAFNYIAKRIRETNKVTNAEFVFHPVRGINDAKWLYPGDEYVDWYGISLFNHDVCYPTWEGATPPFVNCPQAQAMDDNVKQSLDWAKNTIKKPIIIAESAVQAELTNQHNAAFMKGYIDKITNIIETYDVKAWVYINSNWVGHSWSGQWGDSRVEAINDVKNYWLQKVSTPRYIHYQTPVVTSVQTENANQINVFPNPFSESFTITGAEGATVEIVSLTGEVVLQVDEFHSEQVQPKLTKGAYLLKITKDGKADYRLISSL